MFTCSLLLVYFDNGVMVMSAKQMEIDISRFLTEKASASERITLAVTPQTRKRWLELNRVRPRLVTEIVREFLEKTLPQIEHQISKQHDV